MFYLEKTLEISSSHYLKLPYESKCKNLHGHNWIITVYCKCYNSELNHDMIVDFTTIKKIVMELDHKNLNDELDFNPTAENVAKYLLSIIPKCYKIKIQESKGNIVFYEI